MCSVAGVHLEYLPPYSPDYNPIEEAFAELKAWYKKNRALEKTYDSLGDFLTVGLQHMANKAGNHFRSCHIEVPN